MKNVKLPEQLVLLTASDAAEVLYVSPKTLERWRLEGFGPRWIRVGRKPLYRLSDLIDWLDANTVNSTSETR
jgi:hypothetical protein